MKSYIRFHLELIIYIYSVVASLTIDGKYIEKELNLPIPKLIYCDLFKIEASSQNS